MRIESYRGSFLPRICISFPFVPRYTHGAHYRKAGFLVLFSSVGAFAHSIWKVH